MHNAAAVDSVRASLPDAAQRRALAALRASESRYRRLFETAQDGILLLNADSGQIEDVNPFLIGLLGYSHAEFLGRKIWEVGCFADIAHNKEMFAELQTRGYVRYDDLPLKTSSGARVAVEFVSNSYDCDGVKVIQCNIRDITERKESRARITHLNRVYAVLSAINGLIVRASNRDELFRQACGIAVDKGGFHIALIAMVDHAKMQLVPVASAGLGQGALGQVKDRLSLVEGAATGNPLLTRAIRQKKTVFINDLHNDPEVVFGTYYAQAGIHSLAILPLVVADQAQGVLVLYARERAFFPSQERELLTELAGDIAFAIDHIDKQERLDYLAFYDVLTGLANRNLFLERLALYMRSAVGSGGQLGLFLVDLERFRYINDSLGRTAGDALLRQVADWLKRNLGDASLVARLGADQFGVILPAIRPGGDLQRMVEKTMGSLLAHPFLLDGALFRVAVKVGAALFPDDGDDAAALIGKAETALRKAKSRGEKFLFYQRTMTEAMAGKLTLENQLRHALENGEFLLHYQPKVNLLTGRVTGAEALIRWLDPRSSLVAPGRFIPVLEEIGLIHEVGNWALGQSIRDYLRWCDAGLHAVRIAVNVSPLQLRQRDFAATVGQAIGVDARARAGIELEITEGVIMEDIAHNMVSLATIRESGVRIAIDDFGTGFSSLAYLARLPVDTLKIDRAFVADMTGTPRGLALVSTIVAMAHALGLQVVAEGVETREQEGLLHNLGCDEMQGFLFSKPVPVDQFEERFLTPEPVV